MEFNQGDAVYRYNDTLEWVAVSGAADHPTFLAFLNQLEDVWVNARMESFYYIAGVDTATNPCTGMVSDITTNANEFLTFVYERELAANYALAHSYINNLDSPVEPTNNFRVSRRLSNSLPFANFTYADLAVGTGSAMFTSESIWMGHLPMTEGHPDSCMVGFGLPQTGWRACSTNASVNLNISAAWDTHIGLLSYYTTGKPVGVAGFSDNSIIKSAEGHMLTFNNLMEADRITRDDVDDFLVFEESSPSFGYARDVLVTDAPGISHFARTYFGNPNSENNLTQDDYIFINTPDPSHGLLVLGWGPPESCRDAVINRVQGNNLFSITELSSSAIDGTVPYVADFTRAQQPVPRPFYCTNWNQFDEPNLDFAEHSWFFFVIPDIVIISSAEVYVIEDLNWEAVDGTNLP